MEKQVRAAALVSLVFVLVAVAARAAQGPVACVTCHLFLGGALAAPVQEWNASIHKQNGITCDLCHGGNAQVALGNVAELTGSEFLKRKTQAMSTSRGFIAKPAGKALFAVCSRCHGDTVDRYAASIMGRAYLDGKGGPSCVTCHHAHNNVIPAVPKVCESCHKDTTGFDQIDPMNVTEATINDLSRIRIGLAEDKARGARPALAPGFPEDLDPYVIGLLAFGGVLAVFFLGYLIYLTLEKRR
jgi:Zn finger protein HypA/HybF involved in hydrogenase expression